MTVSIRASTGAKRECERLWSEGVLVVLRSNERLPILPYLLSAPLPFFEALLRTTRSLRKAVVRDESS